jgi:uncharacterized protein (DUF2141 family)
MKRITLLIALFFTACYGFTQKAPTIRITSPVTNTSYTSPDIVTIQVAAEDADGSVTTVELYGNTVLYRTTTDTPYTFTLNLHPGHYSLAAVATDNSYLRTTSNTIDVNVEYPKNGPYVEMLYPAPNSTYKAPASFTIAASADDHWGQVKKVEFYKNDEYVATVSFPLYTNYSRPYLFDLKDVPPGRYAFTAKAFDYNSGSTTSKPVYVTVYDPAEVTSVTLISPEANKTFVAPAAVTLTAKVTGRYDSISKVDFFSDGVLIGTSTKSPYTFAWQNVPAGTYSLVAKTTNSSGQATSSDPVKIFVSNYSIPPSISITSPATNSSYTWRDTITIHANAKDEDGSITKVELFDHLNLCQTITDSPYTFTLTDLSPGRHSFTAVTTDNTSLTTSSYPVDIDVLYPETGPYVEMIHPLNNSTYTAPASFTIAASAGNRLGRPSKRVEFYKNDEYLGTVSFPIQTDYSRPYVFDLNNLPPGRYAFTAKAVDYDSTSAISRPLYVTVFDPAGAPSVSLTSPVANKTFTAPASIVLTADASDKNGSISKIEFYSNNQLIGTTTKSPYSFTWENMSVGSYSITAKATDNDGQVTSSDAIDISVSYPKPAPTVQMVYPVNNTCFAAPKSLKISVRAEAANGYPVKKVDFYDNDILIGSTTSPISISGENYYEFTLNNMKAGNHSFTAKAIDSDSLSTTSTPVKTFLYDSTSAPSVRLVSPLPNETFTSFASITISASTTISKGAISKVEFYNNDTLIGTATTSPYTFTWNNVYVGDYSIAAKAFVDDIQVAKSETVRVTVNYPNAAPMVDIGAPADNTTFEAPASITISAKRIRLGWLNQQS